MFGRSRRMSSRSALPAHQVDRLLPMPYQAGKVCRDWAQAKTQAMARTEDMVKYGMIPEFVGRLPVISPLEPLDVDALMRILREPRNALVRQYQKFFDMEGAELEFTETALREWVKQAEVDDGKGAPDALTLALSYGGRESILEAVRAVAEKVRTGVLRPEQIDEAALTECFQTSELPPVDLIIRTSGELRTSNFLLWESTHAEFYTTPALWPEFTRAELLTALRSVSASRAAGR